jgi:predicted alpha/beta superfamily hydrolase
MIKRTLKNVWSPQRRNRRDVDVYLPAGQNLSDPATAFAGTWDLDATRDRLAWRGLDAIYVGIHNTRSRLAEYSPFPDPRHGGGDADAYLAFLVETLKPRIDRMFNTRRDRDATTIAGSSMGGLVSLYAYFRYPSVFGRTATMSPSIWFGQGLILDFIRQATVPRGRVYLDVGTGEGMGTVRDVRRLGRLLVRKGFRRRRSSMAQASRPASAALRYVEDAGGRHNEAAWASRLEGALAFLLE